MPGRTASTVSENSTLTSKFVSPPVAADEPLVLVALLPTSVTVPSKLVSGSASTLMTAFWAVRTSMTASGSGGDWSGRATTVAADAATKSEARTRMV